MRTDWSELVATGSNLGDVLKPYGVELGRDLVLDSTHVETVRVMQLMNRGGLQFQTQQDFPYALIPVATEFDRSHPLTRALQNQPMPVSTTVKASAALRGDKRFEVVDVIRSSKSSLTKASPLPVIAPAVSSGTSCVITPRGRPFLSTLRVVAATSCTVSVLRTRPRKSYASNASPIGFILSWHCQQYSSRVTSIRCRKVFSGVCGSCAFTVIGRSGMMLPSKRSRIHLPRRIAWFSSFVAKPASQLGCVRMPARSFAGKVSGCSATQFQSSGRL